MLSKLLACFRNFNKKYMICVNLIVLLRFLVGGVQLDTIRKHVVALLGVMYK